ncbi:MAG: sulfotransferase [Gammaproteobacteria bacterium]
MTTQQRPATKKKVVFLIGAGHCGSTLLDLILGSHSHAFSLGEFNRIYDILDRPHKAHPRICGVCEEDCEFWNGCTFLPALRLLYSKRNKALSAIGKISRLAINPYRFLFGWTGKNILVDSSKLPYWLQYQLRFPHTWKHIKPFLVYVARDGRAVVNSYLRKYPDKGVHAITENWITKINQLNAIYNDFPVQRRITVRYEQLATEPKTVLQPLCQLLELEYEDSMLQYWKHAHHHIAGNAGTRSLIFKYRKTLDQNMSAKRAETERGKAYYHEQYYNDLNTGIRLDLRWKNQLSIPDLRIFETMAGKLNEPFRYDGQDSHPCP